MRKAKFFKLLLTVLIILSASVYIGARRGVTLDCGFGDICGDDPCCGIIDNCTITQSNCEAANNGWIWNFASSICEKPPTTSTICDSVGMFWNYSSNNCNDNPQIQPDCDIFNAYWNFTNSTCGGEPAIGNCGGGPDWGNYFSTGCYGGLGLFGGSFCTKSGTFQNKCYQYGGDYDSHFCVCTGCDYCGGSPILIDVPGKTDLTDVDHGVRFDLNGNGTLDRLSWTAPTSTAGWLALDLNRNGQIDSGKELFGNFTFQNDHPDGVENNGFLALAEYDKPANGGNHDGIIDENDAVFMKLRLWQDANHDGISQPGELHGLWEFGIEAISLDYKEARRRDRAGNEFRYRAKLYGANHQDLGRWAYDVWLLSAK